MRRGRVIDFIENPQLLQEDLVLDQVDQALNQAQEPDQELDLKVEVLHRIITI